MVFGGVHGIESCVDDDEAFPTVSGSTCGVELFDYFVNTLEFQGSRTVRTEEAIVATMSRLRGAMVNNTRRLAGGERVGVGEGGGEKKEKREKIEFSDEEVSEEESEGGE